MLATTASQVKLALPPGAGAELTGTIIINLLKVMTHTPQVTSQATKPFKPRRIHTKYENAHC